MMCLKASFTAAHEATRRESLVGDRVEQCQDCPLVCWTLDNGQTIKIVLTFPQKVWFNSLCSELEGQPPAKAQSMLLKRIEGLEQVMMAKGQDKMDLL